MRDFKEFIEKKIAVSCSSAKENIDFVNLCCSNGFKLGYPDYMDRFDKNKLWTVGRIFKDEIFNDNKSFLSEYKIVQASEFLQPQTTIEIFQAKQTVVCLKKEDGKVIARGVAKCSKDDVFNFDYGAELALNRMLENSKNKEFSKTINEVGKKITDSLSATSAGISSVNSAIKAASEEQDRLLKESLFKSNHIQGDTVDAVLPKIKKLKDGTKIIKQDKYEVGDKVLIKKKFVSGTQNDCGAMDRWLGKIMTVRIAGNFTYRMIEDVNELFGSGWSWDIKDIKGKVIE